MKRIYMVQCPGYAARFFDKRKEAELTARKFAINASWTSQANAYVYSADVDSYLPTYVGWLRCPGERKTLLLRLRARDGEIVADERLGENQQVNQQVNQQEK